jgi:FKBP-type peptidyl-prolyl cis-trans isomerase FklB
MRISALSVRIVAVLSFVTFGVLLAQDNMRAQTGARQQRGAAPQGGGNPQAGGAQPGGGLGAIQVRPTQPAAADPAIYRQQISYIIGRQFGDSLRSNEVELDPQALVAGLGDGLKNAPQKWSEAEQMAAMERFDKEMQQKGAAKQAQLVAKNKQQQDAFLAANKTKEGVQTTPSGLQYKVLKAGNGPSPTRADEVLCHYRGVLLDGKEFDSSYARQEPTRFRVGGVIPGWTEALQKMKVGDKWQLFVPSELAYGPDPDPRSGIEPGAMLIFEVELLQILN